MNAHEERKQQQLTEAIETVLELEPGEIVTGFVLCYEVAKADGVGYSGYLYGPAGMTTWRALGLVEWTGRFCLGPDEE